jgi:formylglycine-generating enzyme required for sulfatase activity
LEAPVSHISFYEAQAFAKYSGGRLPTEAEWEVAAGSEEIMGQFLDSEFYHPSVPSRNFQNFSQSHGTLWEWTSSAYAPYPRYESYEGVLAEYNEKFMSQKYVLRGGSCVTPKRHYRSTYRNYYYPQMRWHFCGIRLAKDKL